MKIKTRLSGIKCPPEIKFRDLFAQFLVDKLCIAPKGKTCFAYCVHKARFTLAESSHIRKETVKSFFNAIISDPQLTVPLEQREFSVALLKGKQNFYGLHRGFS